MRTLYCVDRVVLFVAAVILGSAAVCAQSFPNRPIRIITAEVGGGTDFASRVVAPGLTASLGQQVIVDNRQSTLGPAILAKAPPDGHTLLFSGSNIWTSPLLRIDEPYDPVRDFAPVTVAVVSPNILVVHPSMPVKSVKELIALAKSKPGVLNYASSSVGGSPQIAGELFKSMAGLNIVAIQYSGGSQALGGVIRGEAQFMFATASSATAQIKAGKVNALAVTSAQPSALLPDLPTVAASLPGYDYLSSFSVMVPAKTPRAIINRLNQEFVRALNQKDIKARLENQGLEVIGSSPEELAARIKSEMASIGKIIKDAGIRAQ